MSRKASSSHSNSGFSGSGALSHVYIEYPHLRCNIRGARGLFYDDGNKLLVSPTSDQVNGLPMANVNLEMYFALNSQYGSLSCSCLK